LGGSHFSTTLVISFSEIISAPRPLMRAKEKDEKNTRIALAPTHNVSVAHNVDQRNFLRAQGGDEKLHVNAAGAPLFI